MYSSQMLTWQWFLICGADGSLIYKVPKMISYNDAIFS